VTAAPTSPRRWFAPVPTRRVTAVRALVFGYAAVWLLVRLPYVSDVTQLPDRRFEPVGVLGWLDTPPPRWAMLVCWAVALGACAAAAAGRWWRVAAPIGAVATLVIATFTSSFGQVFHTEHLLVIHLGILAAAAVVEPPTPDGETSGWPLNLMMAVVVVTYVAAGVAKLRWSGPSWVSGDVLQHWIAVDNLRKLLVDDLYSPLGGWLSQFGWVWTPIAALTLLVELGAPAALTTGRVRTAWVVAAWSFHVGVFALMAISFPYQLSGIAYAAFLPMERIVERSARVVRRRAQTNTAMP
jgi:hypothetical protein